MKPAAAAARTVHVTSSAGGSRGRCLPAGVFPGSVLDAWFCCYGVAGGLGRGSHGMRSASSSRAAGSPTLAHSRGCRTPHCPRAFSAGVSPRAAPGRRARSPDQAPIVGVIGSRSNQQPRARAAVIVAAAMGSHDLLIVGPGVLGSFAGKLWKEAHPQAQVVAQTNTASNHERWARGQSRRAAPQSPACTASPPPATACPAPRAGSPRWA